MGATARHDVRDACPLVLQTMQSQEWPTDTEILACGRYSCGACLLTWGQGRSIDCAFFGRDYRMAEKALGLVKVVKPGSDSAGKVLVQ